MARLARVVVPGAAHHVTQRGNRRQRVFFKPTDYRAYIDLMAEWCRRCNVDVLAYCLMPNHVHLIAVPKRPDGLARAIGEAHRRYTRLINFREGWRGYLWQGRFSSFPMDEDYLLTAARYVENNPVRARMVTRPDQYRWSSARAHLRGTDDALARVAPLLKLAGDWRQFLRADDGPPRIAAIRSRERTGRPLGSDGFVRRCEKRLKRQLRLQKPGPKPKTKGN